MEPMTKLVKINRNFQRSVNLQLDLGSRERVASYIPTRSSAVILRRYLEAAAGRTSDNATILIGPYGKGKSHLLLVLLALLHRDLDAEERRRILVVDSRLEELVPEKKYLPVLIAPTSGNNLDHAFLAALQEALKREGLEDIAPETYFSQAEKTIVSWQEMYPAVYDAFCQTIDIAPEEFCKRLQRQDKAALQQFTALYPGLTAGSTFMPLLQTGALAAYRQVNHILTEDYGYAGMFLVFDEFSKYLEGHETTGFSADMKTLQDLCELANNSGNRMFLTMVAHKSIHEYTRSIDSSVKNAFRGVEGRIREIEFIVSAQNHYELIADTIEKCEPEFSKEYKKIQKNKQYVELMELSYSQPCFSNFFSQTEFAETIARGCFPMTPLGAYALLHISEKVAQNERTIFTFLADEGQGSLSWLIAHGLDRLVGVDCIYDYFKNLFRETVDAPQIHNEWLKAEYALNRAEGTEEAAVIKAVAIIRMLHREDELPAQDAAICAALGMDRKIYDVAMEKLKKKDILIYRTSAGIYAFRSNVGVDVEKAIAEKMQELRGKISICETLRRVSELEYELPKQYNQEYAITRYFQYEYIEVEEFFRLTHAQYLFEEKFADGKLLLLIEKEPTDSARVQRHLDRLGDARVLALVSDHVFVLEELLLKYEAVRALQLDGKFIEENEILLQELSLCSEDIVFEINVRLEEDFLPENGNVCVMRAGELPVTCRSAAEFNAILSNICARYYGFSPKVNHELLNIEHIGSQYLRARNTVVTSLLEGDDCEQYLTGTTPPALVYRAAFVHTSGDLGCEELGMAIDAFFDSCAGEKRSFQELYLRLQGEGFGVRKGVIPLFLAKKLADAEETAVVYLGGKELGVSAETLNHVNEFPEKYQLYIEPESAAKEHYLKALEEIFCEKGMSALSKQSRLTGVTACMQKWYRSLPQYAMVTMDFPEGEAEEAAALRNLLRRAEINPRELVFDRIPACFAGASYTEVIPRIARLKTLLTEKLERLKEKVANAIRSEFHADRSANLKACLFEWYGAQSKGAKSHVLSTTINSFMNYLADLSTNDEKEIVSKLSRIVLDIYMEDWNDETLQQFCGELHRIRTEVEQIGDDTEKGRSHIILEGAGKTAIDKYYEADTSDSTSLYLKNMIEEALEDFGNTLEMNQKIAVLVQTIEKLLQ